MARCGETDLPRLLVVECSRSRDRGADEVVGENRRPHLRQHHRRRLAPEPGPIRKILTHLGEPLEPPPVSPARGPPTDWGELVQIHDDRNVFQASPDELPAIDIHKL